MAASFEDTDHYFTIALCPDSPPLLAVTLCVHHPALSLSADSFNHTRQALVSLRHFPTASIRSSEQERSRHWGRPPKCVQRKPETLGRG